MTTERQNLFLAAMTSLFQVQQSVTDLFFKNRLREDMGFVLEAYVRENLGEARDYVRSLKQLNKTLEEIMYLERADVLDLALAREQVLRCIHASLHEINLAKQKPVVPLVTEKATTIVQAPTSRPISPPQKFPRRDKKGLTETQEKILDFVRQAPDRRAKEVVNEFSALSQRTVKRSLKELSDEGKIIRRVEEGGAVYYSAV